MVAALLGGALLAAPLRVYFVGNSVTDTVHYEGLAKASQASGKPVVVGRHMIPGAPLSWLWDHAGSGFTVPEFGPPPKAFRDHRWDVVSLQPFDRQIEGDGQDLVVAGKYLDLLLEKSPTARILVYQRWPRLAVAGKGVGFRADAYGPTERGLAVDLARFDRFEDRYLAKYTGGWDLTNETRDYFERLTEALRKRYPTLRIEIAPVGDAMLELDRAMRSGKVRGYESVYRLYQDGIHLTDSGRFLAGSVYFAKIHGSLPPASAAAFFGKVAPELVAPILEAVGKAVQISSSSR